MCGTPDIIERAINKVGKEQSHLHKECSMFKEFRDEVRLSTPNPSTCSGGSKPAQQILNKYQETVMSLPDHNEAYNETLEENLREEFPPSIADLLILNNPFSSRDKRNFLLEINSSIQARREFDQQLEQEKKSLQAAGTELERIRTELKALSESTIEEQHLENLLDKHETYSALERDCVVLLETRQRNSGDSNRGKATKSMSHELNEYLYNDLETQYPILATGIRAISRIREERKIENNTAVSRMSFGE